MSRPSKKVGRSKGWSPVREVEPGSHEHNPCIHRNLLITSGMRFDVNKSYAMHQ